MKDKRGRGFLKINAHLEASSYLAAAGSAPKHREPSNKERKVENKKWKIREQKMKKQSQERKTGEKYLWVTSFGLQVSG